MWEKPAHAVGHQSAALEKMDAWRKRPLQAGRRYRHWQGMGSGSNAGYARRLPECLALKSICCAGAQRSPDCVPAWLRRDPRIDNRRDAISENRCGCHRKLDAINEDAAVIEQRKLASIDVELDQDDEGAEPVECDLDRGTATPLAGDGLVLDFDDEHPARSGPSRWPSGWHWRGRSHGDCAARQSAVSTQGIEHQVPVLTPDHLCIRNATRHGILPISYRETRVSIDKSSNARSSPAPDLDVDTGGCLVPIIFLGIEKISIRRICQRASFPRGGLSANLSFAGGKRLAGGES